MSVIILSRLSNYPRALNLFLHLTFMVQFFRSIYCIPRLANWNIFKIPRAGTRELTTGKSTEKQQCFHQQNVLPSILGKSRSCKYERLNTELSKETPYSEPYNTAFSDSEIIKKKNTGTHCPLSSSIAKMLKYSVRIEVIILKFSCVYRFISEGFEIVLNTEECSLNWQRCLFFLFTIGTAFKWGSSPLVLYVYRCGGL